MDIATIIGLLIGTGLLLAGIGPANLHYFIDIPSVMMVMGGTAASILINYPLATVLSTFSIVKNCFFMPSADMKAEIDRMIEFATVARKDGLLALEEKLESLNDPFLLRGVQLIIDGVSPESVRSIMEIELAQLTARHNNAKGVIDAYGAAAPAFGMVGTLVGLVLMLQNLDDPSALGPGMAVALITTFYGALVANLVFLPLAGKLGDRQQGELLEKQMMIEGVLAIQAGENPNVIKERLTGFLPPKLRVGDAEAE